MLQNGQQWAEIEGRKVCTLDVRWYTLLRVNKSDPGST